MLKVFQNPAAIFEIDLVEGGLSFFTYRASGI